MHVGLAAVAMLFTATAGLASGAIARAGEPTSTPTPEVTATASPTAEVEATVGPDQVRFKVVHDLNADGTAQDAEPGLANWQIYGGCSDAIQLLTTDEDGYVTAGASAACFRVERPFGWHPTSAASVQLDVSAPAGQQVFFLLHDYGDTVMELNGEALVDGLPARSPTFTLPRARGAECLRAVVAEADVHTFATLIVLGADVAPDCLGTGALEFVIELDGREAARSMFVAGASVNQNFIAGPESMRLYANDIDSVSIANFATATTNDDCGVIVPLTGFVPEGSVRVFVLPDEVRPGCGAPGRPVLFLRDGKPLAPTLQWEPGTPEYSPPLVFTERVPVTDISPPETGSGGYR